jgi:UDP-glucose 6-dehydrogenase
LPRVTVIGTGYLGLVHAVCMADLGHDVLAIDVDAEKIAKAANGETPFFEPGLEPLLAGLGGDGLAVKHLCGHASPSQLVELSGKSAGRR